MTQTQINTHFVNTCASDDLRFIAAYLKVTPKQYSTYASAGRAKLLAYIGTKFANLLAGLGVDFITLANLPSDLAPAPEPEPAKANPFGSAKARATSAGKTPLKGGYTLVKKGLKAGVGDPKWDIWNHIYTCSTFEEVFAKAPAKVIKTGGKSIASPASELNWSLKSGWIVPTASA
jgi:hypothetical protein